MASAVANTAQQMGASLGTALLNTVAASSTAAHLSARAALIVVVAAVAVAGLMHAPPPAASVGRHPGAPVQGSGRRRHEGAQRRGPVSPSQDHRGMSMSSGTSSAESW